MRHIVGTVFATLDHWAESLSKRHVFRAYVFGSLVYYDGAEFLPKTSDVDLVVVLTDESSGLVTGRVRALRYLRGKVRALDGELRTVLKRSRTLPS